MKMKQISIIIPVNYTDITFQKEFSVTEITKAFQQIDHDLRTQGIDYEMMLVTDKSTNITLQDFQIFPLSLQLKFYRVDKQQAISDLMIQGIEYAHYDYISILGRPSEHLPKILKEITEDIINSDEVITTL